MHNPNEWTPAIEVQTGLNRPYLRHGKINLFARLNALQPILDVALQLRVPMTIANSTPSLDILHRRQEQ